MLDPLRINWKIFFFFVGAFSLWQWFLLIVTFLFVNIVCFYFQFCFVFSSFFQFIVSTETPESKILLYFVFLIQSIYFFSINHFIQVFTVPKIYLFLTTFLYLENISDLLISQLTFTCSKSPIETLEKGVKYVQR